MKKLSFSETDQTRRGLWRVYTTSGGESRLIEGIFQQNQEIGPHVHPTGEDCAIVLEGELTYYINNRVTIPVVPGELVFGWQSVIHGYRNDGSQPVHLLIFATPSETGLDYPDDNDPTVHHLSSEHRKLTIKSGSTERHSPYSSFCFISVSDIWREEAEQGKVKMFVDWQRKEAYIFEEETVFLEFSQPRNLLKYTARI